jgi:hypothetical protein
VRGEINRRFTRRSIPRESQVAMRPLVKPNSRFAIPRYKVPKKQRGKRDVGPTRGFTASPEVGPGATVGTLQTRYPRVQVLGQDKRRDMQITRSRASTTSA